MNETMNCELTVSPVVVGENGQPASVRAVTSAVPRAARVSFTAAASQVSTSNESTSLSLAQPLLSSSSSSRKKKTPSRLSAEPQAQLIWSSRQCEPAPPGRTEGPTIEAPDDLRRCLPEMATQRKQARRRKTVKEIIQSRISKEYTFAFKLVPFEPSHESLFRLGEIILSGERLDMLEDIAETEVGTSSTRNTRSQETGIYWACKGTEEGDAMHIFWRDPTVPGELGVREVTANLPAEVIVALSWRGLAKGGLVMLSLRYSLCSPTSLYLDVLLPEKSIRSIAHSFEAPTRQPNGNMQQLVKFFFGVDHIETGAQLGTHPDYDRLLYQRVLAAQKLSRMLPIDTTELDCPLKVTLREYQREAVAWMVGMETRASPIGSIELWQPLEDSRGRIVFYNRLAGCFTGSVPSAGGIGGRSRSPGGILADEMGLGKTLEVISCVLAHPRPGYPLTDDQQGIVVVNDTKLLTDYACVICDKQSRRNKVIGSVSSKCPHCWASTTITAPVPIKATLIVCPATICEQWTDEINLLVGSECALRVLVYRGVSQGYVPPDCLAEFDLIITTYEVLRKEIHHANLALAPHSDKPRFRTPKRYRPLPSPLVAVEFWRVALDEAQMVDQCTAHAAQMVLNIPAVNRWCVTGTPIHRDLSDLYGLFVFLRLAPYDEELWFRALLSEPFAQGDASPLVDVLSRCFRRMSKAEVWDQLGLPQQHYHTRLLQFMPVEEVFYKSQAKQCSYEAFRVADRFPENAVIERMARSDMITLLAPLKRLRQACTHPQAVRGAVISLRSTTYSMDDLLAALIKKTVQEAEEAHRRMIMSLNGLAGIVLLRNDVVSAADFYRQVLWSIQLHKGNVRADPLQQFHAYVNLHKLLQENDQQLEAQMTRPVATTAVPANVERWNGQGVAGSTNGYLVQDLAQEWTLQGDIVPYGASARVPSIPRAPGDDRLMEHAYEVRDKYLKKHIKAQRRAEAEVEDMCGKLSEVKSQFRARNDNKWYLRLINEADSRGDGGRLIKKVKEYLEARRTQFGVSLINRFRDCNGLKYLIQSCIDTVLESRAHLIKVIGQLSANPSKEDIQAAVSCHLRPVKRKRAKCRYCLVREMLTAYEAKLFSIDPQFASNNRPLGDQDESNDELDAQDLAVEPRANGRKDNLAEDELTKGAGIERKGTWQPADIEKTLTCLAAFARSYTAYSDVAHDAGVQCEYMRLLRIEYTSLSSLHTRTAAYVAALDELEMATLRLELAPDEQTFNNVAEKPAYIIRRWELGQQAAQLNATKISGETDLRKKLGQLFYLRNLEKASGLVADSNPEECPTCRGVLGQRWSVLHCGHSLCLECIELLLKNHCPPAVNHERQIRGETWIRIPCPMCRELSTQEEIFYVDTKRQKNSIAKDVKVVGNYSTKVVGIVETLLRIRAEESSAKALVFSNWPSVLVVLQKALTENSISHITILSGSLLQRKVKMFKKNSDIGVLLMPIALGSKGLNLTEASHILLVEPMLNIGDEVQALGRIHRIGQTKETHVYRFIVESTIEQRISEFAKQKRASSAANGSQTIDGGEQQPPASPHRNSLQDDRGMTVRQLTELFASDLHDS